NDSISYDCYHPGNHLEESKQLTHTSSFQFNYESILAITSTITCAKSLSKSGKTTCVSWSPKRVLNSMTLVPSAVCINPAYKIPVNGRPSSIKPSAAFCKTSRVV